MGMKGLRRLREVAIGTPMLRRILQAAASLLTITKSEHLR